MYALWLNILHVGYWLVASRNAPAYKAAKRLNIILNQYLHLDNQYTTTNSNSLASDLIKLKINDKH